ncbi:ornithine cyclodeaminase family protein [Saccharomonospora cyanea]|uniref:Putative ornithine cyclodeaminase, mu-crystallin n=1 Tax=Saccharomonospora cyanea NA-134 TaxID=882082 RepID=H5XHF1_9PSEU|nr:ornithine cyclodeaminase family protein [Saccharomonospora cyanea]EHR60636.1 putative ornithine cyclodeaminase, mu-crystallin [Saccharomonospora cyanea NA-134]
MSGHSAPPREHFRYLDGNAVATALDHVDVVSVVSEALRLHAESRVLLPEEAYLPWRSPSGAANRCLAMPGAVDFDTGFAVGLKTINASLGNVARGLARSQGFTLLLDPETARPTVLLEAARISALRTAAVTAVAATTLGNSRRASLGLIGCGTLAMTHLTLLSETLPTLTEVRVHDIDRSRAEAFHERARQACPALDIRIADSAQECVEGMDLVVPVTTVTEGYIPYRWLSPGTLVSHVSLDDLLPDVIHRADLLVIDDWELVSGDSRRLLGRMYRAGELLEPSAVTGDGVHDVGRRRVDATLGEIVSGTHQGRISDADIVVCNAFGMAILDIAVAHRVAEASAKLQLGRVLEL